MTGGGARDDGAARVVICDDSAIVRAALMRILDNTPGIHVVARTSNGQAAIDAVQQRRGTDGAVEVLVLDLEMPVMDGLTALPLLLLSDPGLRVLISSTTTTPGAQAAMRALSLGAADYVCKPSAAALAEGLPFEQELAEKIAGLARLRRANAPGMRRLERRRVFVTPPTPSRLPPRLLAIGSSTGGPQALFTLLAGLAACPIPIVVAQHMPSIFTPILAQHITRLGTMPCAEAQHGEPLLPGRIYVAPGGRHLLVGRLGPGPGLHAILSDEPDEHHCRPSVDAMLRSAASACPGRVLVVMLTGMGRDGMEGTRAVIEGGGTAFAQDEATSVIWGMPGAIAKAGLCQEILPLDELAAAVRRVLGA
jgi:two-component system chemotaxis response regulator CheB